MKVKSESEVAQSCPTLRDPMDCIPPGSSVHGILQARVLEWGAIAFPQNVRHQHWLDIRFPPQVEDKRKGIVNLPICLKMHTNFSNGASQVALEVKKQLASAGEIRDVGVIPG